MLCILVYSILKLFLLVDAPSSMKVMNLIFDLMILYNDP